MHGGRALDLPGKRLETDRIEHRDGGEVQKRQVAEPSLDVPVAHGQLGVDALFLREPGDRGLLVAEFVDELDLDALAAGEHASVGDAIERRIVEMASLP